MGNACFEALLIKPILGEGPVPSILGSCRVLALDFLYSLIHFFLRRLRRIGTLSLFPKQFLIDQPIEGPAAVLICYLSQWPGIHKSLEANGVVPIALQNHVTVHGGHNSINDVRRREAKACSCQQDEQR